ncbi:retrovirus-related pol polyprotein from transposon TNT 1-94 [Tanacetum coccineum]|uniref:Retrovirus-related pol polyprotein from transposon TNT 1-94 n=1 Tax=Tanacetum coccineum TaxID=301880 RepID=A0ABQ4Y347_9ASTR
MTSNSDDIQAAGSDTRPPMLDRTDYESSVPQQIRFSSVTTLKQRQFGTTSKCFSQFYNTPKKTRNHKLYDEFERFKMLPGENINEYYVRFHKLVNDMRNIIMTMPNIQLNSKFVNNMSPEWDRFVTAVKLNKGNGGAQHRAGNANAGQGKPIKCYNCNGLGHIAQNRTQPKRPQNSGYFKDKMLLMQAQENGAVLDEEELLFLASEHANTFDADVDNQPVQDLALNEDNIFQADECDTFDSDVNDELTSQSIFMANLSLTGPANLQAGPSNASILSEVHILENTIDHSVTNQDEHETHNEVQQSNVIDSTSVDMENGMIPNAEAYSNQIKRKKTKRELHSVKLQLNSTMENNMIFEETVTALKQELKQKESKFLTNFSNLKHLNDKLKNKLHSQDQSIQTVHMMLNPTKAQLKDNSKCVTIPDSKPKVLAPGRYPIDVEPIPPRLKKNREVHLHYIKHLKENVETLREIVEDAKVERPLDTSLASACRYTKHSQELLEYVIGTCPKDFSPRDKQNASTNSLRKKRVTFVEPCETSTHNTPPQVEHQKINSTNAPGIPSTGVKGASAASRSKPRSNTKKDRTLPAKSALKQVEAHSRMNKSNEKQKNRVDSSISYKRTVINSNSNTSCKTCNKCLIFVNHDQCVVRSEMFGKQSPATKVWRVKQVKQVWKATGKLFTTIGHQWRPTGRLLPLGDQWPLTRNTPPTVLPTKQWKPTGRLLPLGRQCPLVRSTALKSDCMPADPQETIAPVAYNLACTNQPDPNCNWGSNVSKSPFSPLFKCRNFVKKFIGTVRFRNDHFGAIMGYGDYVIGDSVISRVYYVEGLGHNLFSVGQFCDSDLEVAFRKHTCFVRDLDGVDLIKGSRGTNLYTISVEDMMRSSPICLLSKASKNKSWLWHRRLNHLNFGTLNDLAHKDLVRGLPRLKFKKDHLCSACQLGKRRKATHKPKTINTITEVLHTLHMDLCGPPRVQSIDRYG